MLKGGSFYELGDHDRASTNKEPSDFMDCFHVRDAHINKSSVINDRNNTNTLW